MNIMAKRVQEPQLVQNAATLSLSGFDYQDGNSPESAALAASVPLGVCDGL